MLNSLTLNGSGRALWVRSATVLATATALAVSAAYGYQQRGAVLGDARVTVTLTTQRATFATTLGLATAGASLAATRQVNGGAVLGTSTVVGLAAVYRLVPAHYTATAAATAMPIILGVLGDAEGLATATGIAAAHKVQFLVGSVLAAATGSADGGVTRYATLTANLATLDYTRAETTLARAGDNPWNDGGSWDDGWQWADATVWQHEGFVPGAEALVTVTVVDILTEIIATVGPYGFSQSYVPAMRANLRQAGGGSALSQATGVVAPTLTTQVTVTGATEATGQVTGVRTVPTAATLTTAGAQSWLAVWRRQAARSASLAVGTAAPLVGDHHQAGRCLGSGVCAADATAGDFYPATTLAMGASSALALLAYQDHAAAVVEDGAASAVSLTADWAHNYQVFAAALAGADVVGAATASLYWQAAALAFLGAGGQGTAWVDQAGRSEAQTTATGSAFPSSDYQATVAAILGALGWTAANPVARWATNDATALATGSATPADQYDADLVDIALATGSATPADQYYADLVGTALVTGWAVSTSLADTPATECRTLRAVAEPRVIQVPFDDRLLRVIC